MRKFHILTAASDLTEEDVAPRVKILLVGDAADAVKMAANYPDAHLDSQSLEMNRSIEASTLNAHQIQRIVLL